MGETTIKAALTHYLSKHEFGNAVTNDLWSAISEKWDSMRAISHSRYTDFNFTVQEMMDTWTLQMGYPIGELIPSNVSIIQLSQVLTLCSDVHPAQRQQHIHDQPGEVLPRCQCERHRDREEEESAARLFMDAASQLPDQSTGLPASVSHPKQISE